MKINTIWCLFFSLLLSLQLRAQTLNQTEEEAEFETDKGMEVKGPKAEKTSSRQFGQIVAQALKSGDESMLEPIYFKMSELKATVRAQTKNAEKVIQEMEEDERRGFDKKIREDRNRRWNALMNSDINWSQIKFEGFEIRLNEKQTNKLGFKFGTGLLKFRYQGQLYGLWIDKMAKTLKGWRGREISTSPRPASYYE